MEVKLYYKDEDTPYKKLVNLLHDAFQERLDAGLNFGCASYDADTLKAKTKNGYIAVLFNEEAIIGMGVLNLLSKKGCSYGITEYIAIDSDYKGKGLASIVVKRLIEQAENIGLDYILSSTATSAESSVKYHLNNGFLIYRIFKNPAKTYRSYAFIIPIKQRKWLNNVILRKMFFYTTWLKMVLTEHWINKK